MRDSVRSRNQGADPRASDERRLAGLQRFAIGITTLNVLGHLFLGFETSWAHPLAALATTYSLELALEAVDAWAQGRRAKFLGGGLGRVVTFLLSAHITGLAVSMLVYANESLAPVVLASAIAIGSKVIFRVSVDGRARHFLNPSNTGIAVVLILFPWVGIAQPYQFTENLSGVWDWLLPAFIVSTGTLINGKMTSRLPLIGGWLGGFVAQAVLRTFWLDASLLSSLAPMTGVAFVLFTFYMVTDPATTPARPGRQVLFGLAVAAAYGALMAFHIVFGLFFALVIVCSLRGVGIALASAVALRREHPTRAAVAVRS